ncbi:hypothetical protein FKG94_14275 [Exilibacterium tricleocarpae]|uniref:Uncharacterized protein n=1 Tax=Exilibacterium tricleocarpae TaxID=2591008 RepID=A0A545TM64_9GAMM|nr:hypothetical protein [Exilibacterium tricleocarpae]TQV78231.1 hypothetical protein FKG94_14275 [Exilibacterium tricleocarpae]
MIDGITSKLASPEHTKQQADKLIADSNDLIRFAASSCDIPAFTPVELVIPQMIDPAKIKAVEPPAIENYFNYAENVWKDIQDSGQE